MPSNGFMGFQFKQMNSHKQKINNNNNNNNNKKKHIGEKEETYH